VTEEVAMTTRSEWAEWIDRWERSGLDVDEFATREGLQPAQLEEWRRELRAASLRRAEPRCGAARAAKLGPTAPPTPQAPPAWVDIHLPDGGLVRLLPGLDGATAACVLAVAAELSCRMPGDRHRSASPSRRSAGGKK
jgi:hypothetical protein